MKQFFFFCVLSTCYLSNLPWTQSQSNVWKSITYDEIAPLGNVRIQVQKAQNYQCDFNLLRQHIHQAPWEEPDGWSYSLEIPNPEGEIQRFFIKKYRYAEQPFMDKFPGIETFLGVMVNQKGEIIPGTHIRGDYTYHGFHAMVHTQQGGSWFVDPIIHQNTKYYQVYWKKDFQRKETTPWRCDLDHWTEYQGGATPLDPKLTSEIRGTTSGPISLRTYQLALSNTGEYAIYHGGTVNAVSSEEVTAINRVNSVLEKEVAIRVILIANNDVLINLDPVIDGYTNGNTGLMINENPDIINGKIPSNSYDYGHVFGTNGGGLAQLQSICSNSKARGVTCHPFPENDPFYIDYVCHEMGHQFGGNHTFNLCDDQNESESTAYEPGSGSTIMSYSGLCGPNNIQSESGDYYHVNTIREIIEFSRIGGGNSCATIIPTNNTEPTPIILCPGNLVLPMGTYLQLWGTGTDAEEKSLYYCWEEFDLGPKSQLGNPQGNAPTYRSFLPTLDTVRTLPALQKIIVNSFDKSEVIPMHARQLKFKLSVRDYHPGGGGTTFDQVNYTVTDQAGPFKITAPLGIQGTWKGGDVYLLKWSVNNTDIAPINIKNVRILLSTDNGYHFDVVLNANTPNDGEEWINIPVISTTKARIKVESIGSIFFAMNTNPITILPSPNPGFSIQLDKYSGKACLPQKFNIPGTFISQGGFNEAVTILLPTDLPAGVTMTSTKSSLSPGDNFELNLDFPANIAVNAFTTLIKFYTAVGDTITRELHFDVTSFVFDDLSILSPVQGSNEATNLVSYSWTSAIHAEKYRLEVSADPDFDPLFESQELTTTTFKSNSILKDNTLYYWRILPINSCGTGAGPIGTFHTQVINCKQVTKTQTITITQSGQPSIASQLFIPDQGKVNIIRLPHITGGHSNFKDLQFILQSPQGTTAEILSNICGTYSGNFDFGSDDDSPILTACPPKNITAKPFEKFIKFKDENLQGTWKLLVNDQKAGDGGKLESWTMEYCSSVSFNPPSLIKNDTLHVKPLGQANVSSNVLIVTDPDNTPNQLKYRVVDLPRFGILRNFGVPLKIGDTYTQADVDHGDLNYLSTDGTAKNDDFLFVCEDPQGGWIPLTQFNILLDPSVSTWNLVDHAQFYLYPQPASQSFTLRSKDSGSHIVELEIVHVTGQTVQFIPQYAPGASVDIQSFPSGMYYVMIKDGKNVYRKELLIQR